MSNLFLRNVAVVLSGSVIAQAIPILAMLFLARLYAPAEFGLFATWFGLASIVAVFLTGRLEMALALEVEGGDLRMAVLAILVLLGQSCVLVALVVLGAWFLVPALGNFPIIMLAFVPTCALMSMTQVWQCWAAAEGRFRHLTMIRVSQAALITALQLVCGYLWPTATSLVLAHGCGVAGGVLIAICLMGFPGSEMGRLGSVLPQIVAFWKRRKKFIFLSLPADVVNTGAAQLPLLIIAHRFGADTAGLLAMALRALGAPIGLVGASVLDVFRRSAATRYGQTGQCRQEYLETLRLLLIGALGLVLVVVPFSEPLFALAFGEQWRLSGNIALWLLPMFALRFIASPLSYMFYVAEKQHLDLIWQLGLLTMTFAALYLPYGFKPAMLFYAVGYSALYVIYLFMSYRFSIGKKP